MRTAAASRCPVDQTIDRCTRQPNRIWGRQCRDYGGLRPESARVSRRLQSLRGWSHGTQEQVPDRGAREGRAAGLRPAGSAPFAVGGDLVGRRQDGMHARDAAEVGPADGARARRARFRCFNGAVDVRRRRGASALPSSPIGSLLQWSRRRSSTERRSGKDDGIYVTLLQWSRRRSSTERGGALPKRLEWRPTCERRSAGSSLQWSRRRSSMERQPLSFGVVHGALASGDVHPGRFVPGQGIEAHRPAVARARDRPGVVNRTFLPRGMTRRSATPPPGAPASR